MICVKDFLLHCLQEKQSIGISRIVALDTPTLLLLFKLWATGRVA